MATSSAAAPRGASRADGRPAPQPDAPGSDGADDLRLEVVRDPAAFDRLRHEWDAAVAADSQQNVFLTWEWVRTWWDHFGDANELHLIVVRDADGVAALAPLQRSRLGAGPLVTRVLQRLSPDAGDYGGLILVRRQSEAVELLVDHLHSELRHGRAAAAMLSRLASDDPLLGWLRDALARRARLVAADEVSLGGACPLTDLRQGFDLARHAKKHKVRQRLRRLGEHHGEVTFARHSGDDLAEGLDRLLQVHTRRWEGRDGQLQGLLATPAQEAFLLDAVRALDARGWVRLLTLTADGRPVAADLDLAYGSRVVLLKGAFDPDYGAYSPGQLLHHRVFEDALADGIEVVDFGRGDQPYKRRWANGERHLATLTLTRPGAAGRVARHRVRIAQALSRRLGR